MTRQQSSFIKMIALLTMLADHIGAILFPNQIWLRIIGRLSFPLFAYQLGVGFDNTKNFKKYILRLFALGVATQLVFVFAVNILKVSGVNINHYNILFTLSLGLLSLYFYKINNFAGVFLSVILPYVLSRFGIFIDYGVYGVAAILILYIERNNPVKIMAALTVITLVYCYSVREYIQLYSLFSLAFIYHPVSLSFKIPNGVFYWFYPLHLAVIYLIGALKI